MSVMAGAQKPHTQLFLQSLGYTQHPLQQTTLDKLDTQTQLFLLFPLDKFDIHFDMDVYIYNTTSNIHVTGTSVPSLSLG